MNETINYVIYVMHVLLLNLSHMYFDINNSVSIYDGLIFLLCITIVTMIFRRITHAN